MTPRDAAARRNHAVQGIAGRRKSEEEASGFPIAFGRCESPIEQAFCLELFQVPGIRAVEGDFDHRMLGAFSGVAEPRIYVFAQQPVPPYRADFMLLGVSPLAAEPLFIIAECDGLAYHSAREQKRRDARRQEALQRTGFVVIRFSGSEIYREPAKVVGFALAAFTRQGWRDHQAARWVNNAVLKRALAELRQAEEAAASRQCPLTQTQRSGP